MHGMRQGGGCLCEKAFQFCTARRGPSASGGRIEDDGHTLREHTGPIRRRLAAFLFNSGAWSSAEEASKHRQRDDFRKIYLAEEIFGTVLA
jgi:hypothetical protein